MAGNSSVHLSEEQLGRFEDGDLSREETGHLESCPYCQSRLGDLRAAAAAYVEYRDSVRAPSLPPPPSSWESLDAMAARKEVKHPASAFRWWSIPVLAGALGLVVIATLMHQTSQRPATEATDLLLRAARVDLPEGRRISMRARGRTFVRPAVLTTGATSTGDVEIQNIGRLFVAANYDWQEPLSARSYQAWRTRLRNKRDTVSVVRSQGQEQAYRIQTDSPSGVLRSASLTLRANDLHPTSGAFRFETDDTVELDESVPLVREESKSPTSITKPRLTETPAGPEDTLHVLEALNKIGADVGEPIEVLEDPQHRRVLVRASGISPERAHEIAAALEALPAVFTLNSGDPGPPAQPQTSAGQRYSTSIPPALRQQFEDRFGGAVALQEVTDRVLENSASLLARSHALEMLASKFPPDVEARLGVSDRRLLDRLRAKHVSELARLLTTIQGELKPLISSDAAPTQPGAAGERLPWQARVPSLVASTRETDTLLNTLLSGSYSQSSGDDMLQKVAVRTKELAESIKLQSKGEK